MVWPLGAVATGATAGHSRVRDQCQVCGQAGAGLPGLWPPVRLALPRALSQDLLASFRELLHFSVPQSRDYPGRGLGEEARPAGSSAPPAGGPPRAAGSTGFHTAEVPRQVPCASLLALPPPCSCPELSKGLCQQACH